MTYLWTTIGNLRFVTLLCAQINSSSTAGVHLWLCSMAKSQLMSMDPQGRQFDFKERAIFARFDDFCRRIAKLADLFSMIQQFRDLKDKQVSGRRGGRPRVQLCHIRRAQMDGMGRHIVAFFHLIKTLRHNRHDLLNFEDNAFDISYVEFLSKVEGIELQLQVCCCLACYFVGAPS